MKKRRGVWTHRPSHLAGHRHALRPQSSNRHLGVVSRRRERCVVALTVRRRRWRMRRRGRTAEPGGVRRGRT
jgi:hypothetical protein